MFWQSSKGEGFWEVGQHVGFGGSGDCIYERIGGAGGDVRAGGVGWVWRGGTGEVAAGVGCGIFEVQCGRSGG